jgi:hypothetical protein
MKIPVHTASSVHHLPAISNLLRMFATEVAGIRFLSFSFGRRTVLTGAM